ncbi:GNAT family N-acetyltransferase [Leuconostoc koreense]|nr:GNAT family N-acetyltransferase [Leuconostoc mesenteroides]QGM25696.1 GNAT family N-acetyltransferase [Leuconostoc mesenteroides subsp. mesenteroides]
MTFRELKQPDEQIFNDWINSWINEPEIVAVAKPISVSFAEYLTNLAQMKNNSMNNFVPVSNYFFIEDGLIKGGVSARWELNAHLLQFGGHIGYGVAPAWRQQGIAKKMLELTLHMYQQRKISPVLVTAEKWNTASRKTIEAHGGVLENIIKEPSTGKLFCRYWIDLNN